jgi:hypothetical protein
MLLPVEKSSCSRSGIEEVYLRGQQSMHQRLITTPCRMRARGSAMAEGPRAAVSTVVSGRVLPAPLVAKATL